MEVAVRGWSKDHGEKAIAKRDLATARIGTVTDYVRSETYIVPNRSGVEICTDAKINLNGDYLMRLALSREEIASLFFLLYADLSLEELVDHFVAIRSLHEQGPLPKLPFDKIMLKRVDELDLSVRSANCLKNNAIVYVGDLVQRTEAELLRSIDFGRKSVTEIKEVIQRMKLHLGMDVPDWPPENLEGIARRYNEHGAAIR